MANDTGKTSGTKAPAAAAPPSGGGQSQQDQLVTVMRAMREDIKRDSLARQSDLHKANNDLVKEIMATAATPLMKVLDTINKLRALFVMPFVNLLIPLVLPLLYFLNPIVKLMNIMMRPLLIQMMDWLKGQKGNIQAAAKDIMSGTDVLGGLTKMSGIMLEGITKEIKGLIDIFGPIVMAGLNQINDWIKNTFGIDILGTIKTIGQAIIDPIGTFMSYIIDTFGPDMAKDIEDLGSTFLIKTGEIAHNLLDLVGQFAIAVSDILKPLATDINDFLVPLYSDIANVVNLIIDYIGPLIEKIVNFIGEKVQELVNSLSPIISAVSGVIKGINVALEALVRSFLGRDADFVITNLQKALGVGPYASTSEQETFKKSSTDWGTNVTTKMPGVTFADDLSNVGHKLTDPGGLADQMQGVFTKANEEWVSAWDTALAKEAALREGEKAGTMAATGTGESAGTTGKPPATPTLADMFATKSDELKNTITTTTQDSTQKQIAAGAEQLAPILTTDQQILKATQDETKTLMVGLKEVVTAVRNIKITVNVASPSSGGGKNTPPNNQ